MRIPVFWLRVSFVLFLLLLGLLLRLLFSFFLLLHLLLSLFPRVGKLRTQKLKSRLSNIESLKIIPLKPGKGQYIAIHATLTARNFFLANFCPSDPFSCIFSKTFPEFLQHNHADLKHVLKETSHYVTDPLHTQSPRCIRHLLCTFMKAGDGM